MTLRTPLAAACAAVLLAACGGGSDSPTVQPPLSCSIPDQNTWLRNYMDTAYFWYALAPRPDPGAFGALQDYFDASLFADIDHRAHPAGLLALAMSEMPILGKIFNATLNKLRRNLCME